MNYDLENRVANFGESIITFVRTVKIDFITKPLMIQLIRSSTSIGANYMEANHASSNKDFANKICIAKKEANESKHWLRMLAKSEPERAEQCRKLWQEAHELTLILAKIHRSCKEKEFKK